MRQHVLGLVIGPEMGYERLSAAQQAGLRTLSLGEYVIDDLIRLDDVTSHVQAFSDSSEFRFFGR
ncbi:MAG: hypothetical protein VYC59_08650, partial [Chloroflexota bacterium]|nr:hypothetical protein [Chloroflexota bacterium]